MESPDSIGALVRLTVLREDQKCRPATKLASQSTSTARMFRLLPMRLSFRRPFLGEASFWKNTSPRIQGTTANASRQPTPCSCTRGSPYGPRGGWEDIDSAHGRVPATCGSYPVRFPIHLLSKGLMEA